MGSQKLYAILPILNKSTVINASIPWVLSEDLILRDMEEREKRLISEDSSIIFPTNEVCGEIFILSLDNASDNARKGDASQKKRRLEEYVKEVALCLQTVFNLVSNEETMVIPFGLIMEEEDNPKILYTVDFEQDFSSAKLKAYNILTNITSGEVQQLLVLLRKVIKSDPQLKITLRRFCSTFLKSSWEDRLIDLTIALESLVPAQTEISFRFSFFLSLIISDDKSKRHEIYNQLHDLYAARSSIVHGALDEKTAKKAISSFKENWKELVNYTKQAILYRIDFINKYPDGDWKNHFLDLGFGESKAFKK
jgi:hypothetical protein